MHFILNNQLKQLYKDYMSDKLTGLKFNKPNLEYKIFYGRAWRHDKLNVWAVISKFFLDALVHYQCIEDDSDDYVWTETFIFWWIDRGNPRCEITITGWKESELTPA